AFEPGTHASTFGGNFLAARAGLAVLEALFEDGVLQRAAAAGERLREGLIALSRRRPEVFGEVRGLGLMLGVELKAAGSQFLSACLKRGILVNVIAERVLRLLPPLIVSDEEIDQALSILEQAARSEERRVGKGCTPL